MSERKAQYLYLYPLDPLSDFHPTPLTQIMAGGQKPSSCHSIFTPVPFSSRSRLISFSVSESRRPLSYPVLAPNGPNPQILLWEASAGIEGHPNRGEERLGSLKVVFGQGWHEVVGALGVYPSHGRTVKVGRIAQSIEAERDSDLSTSNHFEQPSIWSQPLRSERERWLAEVFVGSGFCYRYSIKIKSFYVHEHD